jgi:transposase InsO family protein
MTVSVVRFDGSLDCLRKAIELCNGFETLNREIFTTLTEAKVLIADWRKEYNQIRPHSSLHYRPPAPEAKMSVTLAL